MRVVVWLGLVVVPFSGVWAQDCNETDSASRAVFFRYGLDDGQQGRAERISNCKPYQDGYANGRGIRSLAAPRAVAAPNVQPNVSKPPVNGVSVTVPHVNRPLFGGGGRNDVEAFTRDGRAFVIGADGRAREVRAGEGAGQVAVPPKTGSHSLSQGAFSESASTNGRGRMDIRQVPGVNPDGSVGYRSAADSWADDLTGPFASQNTSKPSANPTIFDRTGGNAGGRPTPPSSFSESANSNGRGVSNRTMDSATAGARNASAPGGASQRSSTNSSGGGGSGGSQKSNSGSGGRSIGNGGGV